MGDDLIKLAPDLNGSKHPSCLLKNLDRHSQGIVGCTPTNVPRPGKSLYISPISRGYLWVFSSASPRIPNENTINTMVVHVR